MFDVHFEPSRVEGLTGISAAIVVDLDDGSRPVAGDLDFFGEEISEARWEGESFHVPAGDRSVVLDVDPEIIEALGPEYRMVFADGIIGSTVDDYPVLQLSPPFGWAGDDEGPTHMAVSFESFVVKRGCDELSFACSPTHVVQVVAIEPGPNPWPEHQLIVIESPGARPSSDAWYLDPGPLGPRGGDDVLWTGQEMIVWGGAAGDRPPDFVEGAAFDPATLAWRLLPPPPIDPAQTTRAVWVGDEMVVMSRQATLVYNPGSDSWRAIGDGFLPSTHPEQAVVVDGLIYTLAPTGLLELDPATGSHHKLPSPDRVGFDQWRGALRALDGSLYAIGLKDGICQGRHISRWSGQEWDTLPDVSLATDSLADCTYANQTGAAGGRLIVWGDRETPSYTYDPSTDEWTEIDPITTPGTEGPLGPLSLGDQLLVPQYGEGSVYDPATGTWTAVSLPGGGNDTDMVWTGEEVLTWGAACCYGTGSDLTMLDAWRWTPQN
jgi:hypothetical protein